MPTDRLFGGDIEDFEKSGVDYSPDDAAPWTWNLEAEMFTLDLDWDEFSQELQNRVLLINYPPTPEFLGWCSVICFHPRLL